MRTNTLSILPLVLTVLVAGCGSAPSDPDAGAPGTDTDGGSSAVDAGGATTGNLRVLVEFGTIWAGRTAFSLKVDGETLSPAFDTAMLAAETQGDLPGRDTVFLPIPAGEHTLEATGTIDIEVCRDGPNCNNRVMESRTFSGSATFTATAGGHQVAFVNFFLIFPGPGAPPQPQSLVKVVDVTAPSPSASLVVQRGGEIRGGDVTFGWVPRTNACEGTRSVSLAPQASGAFTVPAATEGYFWVQAIGGAKTFYELPALNEGEVYPVLSASGGLLLAPQASGARTAATTTVPNCGD